MRIATWNLERPKRGSVAKNHAILSKMMSVNADLWVLTETNAAVALNDYKIAATGALEGYHRPGENFTTILSRWPILQTIPVFNPLLSICVEIDAPKTKIILYGTIITYANDRGPKRTSKRWQEHRQSIENHHRDWALLRRKFPNHTFIVAGDFNQSRDGSGWYENVDSVDALTEALAAANLTCLTNENFRTKFHLSRSTVDHICVSESVSGQENRVGAWEGEFDGRRLSDHNGVYADFDA